MCIGELSTETNGIGIVVVGVGVTTIFVTILIRRKLKLAGSYQPAALIVIEVKVTLAKNGDRNSGTF